MRLIGDKLSSINFGELVACEAAARNRKPLMEKLIQNNNANNNKENNSKLKENIRPPGKPFTLRRIGGISQRQSQVSFSFLILHFEFRYFLVSSWIGLWQTRHLLFLSI
jgi:hypothetical protein